MVLWEYFLLILDKSIGRYVPVRFISFALVGGTGVVVHLCVLVTLFKALGTSFVAAQTAATFTAITTNFFLMHADYHRVKPGSTRPGVGGEHDGALVVRVSARAVDGKATEAALAAVAASFGVHRSTVRLVSGASSRTKIIDIDAG